MRPVARVLGLICIVVWTAACASSSKPSVDAGRFNGNAYENASLGFQVVLPTGWVFLRPEQLDAAARQLIAESGPQSAGEKASMARTTMLFGLVDLTHVAQPGETPRSIAATLERLDDSVVGMTSETYAAATRMTLETNPRLVTTFGKWHHQTLAGRDFVVLPTVVETEGMRAHQDYFVRVENGQALGLVVAYPENSASPQEALDAFQPLPQTGRDRGVAP